MRRLGEILLDWGVIALSELHTGLDACRRSGGRLGTQLLKFGFVNEHSLLEALSEQCRVPAVSERMLQRAPQEARRLLPAKVARRLEAVPFGNGADTLRVAMVNPNDPATIDEISQITGMRVEPFVATEAAIKGLIAELEDDLVEMVPEGGQDGSAAVDDGAAWEELWSPPRLRPPQLLIPPRRQPEVAEPLLATFPGLEPVVEEVASEPEHAIDEATFRERLSQVRYRDEVARLLLRLAAGYLGRLCLLAVHRGTVVGWMARGQGVVVDDVQSFSLSVEEASLLGKLHRRPDPWLGRIPDEGADALLGAALGEPPPRQALILPVRVRDRTVAFLVGDNPGEKELAIPVDELAEAARKAGLALEMLIMRKKILS